MEAGVTGTGPSLLGMQKGTKGVGVGDNLRQPFSCCCNYIMHMMSVAIEFIRS